MYCVFLTAQYIRIKIFSERSNFFQNGMEFLSKCSQTDDAVNSTFTSIHCSLHTYIHACTNTQILEIKNAASSVPDQCLMNSPWKSFRASNIHIHKVIIRLF